MNPEDQGSMEVVSNDQPTIHVVDDHEISMAKAQVYRAAKNALELHKMMGLADNLEGWVQAKITLASDYLESVKNYMEYEMVSSTLAEGTDLKKKIAERALAEIKIDSESMAKGAAIRAFMGKGMSRTQAGDLADQLQGVYPETGRIKGALLKTVTPGDEQRRVWIDALTNRHISPDHARQLADTMVKLGFVAPQKLWDKPLF